MAVAASVPATHLIRKVTTVDSTVTNDAARPRRLTPTERRIIAYVAANEGKPCSKAKIAENLGRNVKTVNRLVSRLRDEGILVCEYLWAENGAQLANSYRLAREPGHQQRSDNPQP